MALTLLAGVFWGIPAEAAPHAVRIFPAPGSTGVSPDTACFVDIEDADGALEPSTAQFRLNGRPVDALVQTRDSGARFLTWLPSGYVPLQTVELEFSVEDRTDPPLRLTAVSRFHLSRWEAGRLMPGYDGHPLEGISCNYALDGSLHIAMNDDHRLLYTVFRDGTLSEPTLIDDNVYKAPILRRDLRQVIHVAWYSLDRGGVLRYANNQFGEFSEPVEFAAWMFPYSEAMPFDMTVDYLQFAHLVWTEEALVDSPLYYSLAVTWLPPIVEVAHDGGGPYLEPRIGVNFSNKPQLVWRAKQSNYSCVYWMRKFIGEYFQAPIRISQGNDLVIRNLQLLVDSDKYSHVLWEQRAANESIRRLAYATDKPERGAFPPPQLVAELPEAFRFDVKLLFPDRLYVLARSAGGLFYTTNSAGSFGPFERISPLAVSGCAIALTAENQIAALAFGDQAVGLTVFQAREPRHRPVILAAGWNGAEISSERGGELTLSALAYDPGGDLTRLEARTNGLPTGFELPLVRTTPEGYSYFALTAEAPPGLDPGEYLLELIPFDEWGQAGTLWPYLEVVPARDFFGAPSSSAASKFTETNATRRATVGAPSAAAHRPAITMAGFWLTDLSTSAGGVLCITAAVTDDDDDIFKVEVLYEGATVAELNDDGVNGDKPAGDGVYTLIAEAPAGLPWGSYELTLRAVDRQGLFGLWPVLEVTP